jgi:hypothetical protein
MVRNYEKQKIPLRAFILCTIHSTLRKAIGYCFIGNESIYALVLIAIML